MSVDKQSKQKTAACTHCGHCEHLGMSSVLTNTPAVFQALVNNVPKERRSTSYIGRTLLSCMQMTSPPSAALQNNSEGSHGEVLTEQSIAQHQQNQGADC